MDNEPDIWNGTHDDVMKSLIPVSEFMDRYIDLAKAVPNSEIKICGPVTTSEWQWFRWGDENITVNGRYYCSLSILSSDVLMRKSNRYPRAGCC